MSRCAVCSLLWKRYPAQSANIRMTFLRYILHWQLLNSTSISEHSPNRPYSSHSTWCADFSLLGKKPPHTWHMLGCGVSVKRHTTQCPVGIWGGVVTLLRLRPVANWLLVLTIDNWSYCSYTLSAVIYGRQLYSGLYWRLIRQRLTCMCSNTCRDKH